MTYFWSALIYDHLYVESVHRGRLMHTHFLQTETIHFTLSKLKFKADTSLHHSVTVVLWINGLSYSQQHPMETPKLTLAASCGGCVHCVVEKTRVIVPLPLLVFKFQHFLRVQSSKFLACFKRAALQRAEMCHKVSKSIKLAYMYQYITLVCFHSGLLFTPDGCSVPLSDPL